MSLRRPLELGLIGAAFAFSGFAALVYQLVWQRLLFGAIGVDVESVTVVVSVFMLGLGIGAWLGGWVADRFPRRIVGAFAGFELGIAGCGLASVAVLVGLADALALLPRLGAGAACFALLLLPTVLMGATLPMLVAHAAQSRAGIGRATGWLYFVNTTRASPVVKRNESRWPALRAISSSAFPSRPASVASAGAGKNNKVRTGQTTNGHSCGARCHGP